MSEIGSVPAPFSGLAFPFSRLLNLGSKNAHLLKRALQVVTIRVAGAAITYASMILLARLLGVDSFGIYAYVLVMVTLLGLAFSFGLNSASLKFVADYLARNQLRRLSGFLNRSYRLVALLSILGSTLGAAFIYLCRSFIEPYFFVPLLVGFVCVPVFAMMNQLEATSCAFGWMNIAYAPSFILRPLLLTAIVGGIALSGGRPDAASALWALAAAGGIAACIQGRLVGSNVLTRMGRPKPLFHTAVWMKVSLSFLAIDGFRMLLDNTDVMLIGKFLEPHNVAIYYAVIRTSGLIAFISFSIAAMAVPKFAEIHRTKPRDELQKYVSNTIQMMFWPTLLAAFALAATGPFLLSLFGPEFTRGYPTMLMVLTGLVLRSATSPVEFLLNMTGHHTDTLRVYALAAVLNIILNLLLIPSLGIFGAALGSYTAMLAGNLALYMLVKKRLGIKASIFTIFDRSAGQVSTLPA